MKRQGIKYFLPGLVVSFSLVSLTGCATSLIHAVETDDTKTMNALLHQGANPNQTDKFGRTPLTLAAAYLNLEEVKDLLDYGANVNMANDAGRTPLFYAAQHGRTNVTKILLEHGANPNMKDNVGNIPLEEVGDNADEAKLLLDHGADPNIKTPEGTPLGQAVAAGYIDVVKILLDHGANPYAEYFGKTILKEAMETGNNAVIEIFAGLAGGNRAEAAEAKGHYREAFQDYLGVLRLFRLTPNPSSDYVTLLKRMVRVSHHLGKLPVVPPDYRREMVVGLANVKDAKTKEDYQRALVHFLRATRIAPWVPQPYEAAGHILETQGNYGGAAKYFTLYLLTNPHAPNAQAIQDRIYVLEDKAGIRSENTSRPKTPTIKYLVGLYVKSINPDLATKIRRKFRLKRIPGVLVRGVLPGSGAEKAGLKEGDIVIEIDRHPVSSFDNFVQIANLIPENAAVLLTVIRISNHARKYVYYWNSQEK